MIDISHGTPGTGKLTLFQIISFCWCFPVPGAPCKIPITSTKWDYLKESVSFPVPGAPCEISITSTKWDYLKESVSFPVPGAPCKIPITSTKWDYLKKC